MIDDHAHPMYPLLPRNTRGRTALAYINGESDGRVHAIRRSDFSGKPRQLPPGEVVHQGHGQDDIGGRRGEVAAPAAGDFRFGFRCELVFAALCWSIIVRPPS